MTINKSLRSGRAIVSAALVAALFMVGEGQSRQPNRVAKADVKVQEAAILKNAYMLMAMGDHDYNGHRVKAMAQVKEAIKRIDHTVMKDGTNGQKVVAADEEINAARTAFIARHQRDHHEGQAISDIQMREAGELLAKVHASLTQAKHSKAREHVRNAMKEVEIALKTR